MEREIKKIITPISKQEVVLKSWINAKERRNINSVLFENSSYEAEEDGVVKPKFTGEVISKSEDATIIEVVVSIDGKKENILDEILNMKIEDFDFILKEINEITGRGTTVKKNQ